MIDKILRVGVEFFDIVRCGTFSYKELVNLNKIQYYNIFELSSLISSRVEDMVNHAYHHSPFYRKLYRKKKIDVGNISKVSDLQSLPIINKKMLRENFPDNVLSKKYLHRARYDRTSGSTGEPFEFYNDVYSSPIRQSAYMFFNTWMGVGPHSTHVQIASPKAQTRYSIIRNKVFKKNKISTLEINRKFIAKVVNRINEINPVYLEGYSASLFNTAQHIEEFGLELSIKPKAIIATSEDLLETHRKKIEDVFDSPVYNRYGSREFSGAIAQECSLFEGSHVNTALAFIEIVDDEGDPVAEGERGRIIITDLHNKVMPFIRYDIGDSAIKGPESGKCGRNFPLILDIKGKSEFFLISNQDEKTPIETVQSYLFQKYAPNVHQFQFLHRNKGDLLVKIVPSRNFNDEIVDGILEYLGSTLKNFTFSVKIVDEIPPHKSGKTPYFVIEFPH